MAFGGDKRQNSFWVGSRRSIHHVLDIGVEETIDDGSILAHHGIEICFYNFRVRLCWCGHGISPGDLARFLADF